MNPGVSPWSVYAGLGVIVGALGVVGSTGALGPFADWAGTFVTAYGSAMILRALRGRVPGQPVPAAR